MSVSSVVTLFCRSPVSLQLAHQYFFQYDGYKHGDQLTAKQEQKLAKVTTYTTCCHGFAHTTLIINLKIDK